jgi:N-acetylglucosaminyldiphosphoundecaprenol N-acetyl-beta-D-mannosaminyltransferase
VVFTPNVDHLVKLQRDQSFKEIYDTADYRLCDSKILIYAAKFLGSPICEKISGSDFFPAFYEHHRNHLEVKLFLLGAPAGVAAEAQRKINRKVGREMVVGSYSPPIGFETDTAECDRIIQLVNASGATVLAVGVGAPKQEKFIHTYKNRFSAIKIFLAVGATLDFEAGQVNRAPKWISKAGLEWLYRLVSEPKRLWKRYLLEDPMFLWLVFAQKLNLYSEPFQTFPTSDVQFTRVAGNSSRSTLPALTEQLPTSN